MRIFKLFIFFCLILSCSKKNLFRIEDGANYYEYFDEYKIEGVNPIADINKYKNKYLVSIINKKDSLILYKIERNDFFLYIFNNVMEKKVYYKKNNSWVVYNKVHYEKSLKTYNKIEYYYDKLISNDTIYTYNYSVSSINKNYIGGTITLSTKENSIFFYDRVKDLRNDFTKTNVITELRKCTNKDFFKKVYKKDSIYIYNSDDSLFDKKPKSCFGVNDDFR